MRKSVCLGALALALCGFGQSALAADAFSSDWAEGLKSSARLIAAPANGASEAAVEIKLAPGAITYWRNPGDAGLPPTLSFEGSDNLAQAQTSFPAPRRLAEGDGEAFGYDGTVVLPIVADALDPNKPITLKLKLNYAVCEKICVPAQADLSLVLPRDPAKASPFAETIAKAKASIPRAVAWESLGANLTAVNDKAWRLCLPAQAGSKRDLFIEPPERWWFDVKPDPAGADCFRLDLAQQPADAAFPVTAQLTMTGGAGPVETSVALRPGAKP